MKAYARVVSTFIAYLLRSTARNAASRTAEEGFLRTSRDGLCAAIDRARKAIQRDDLELVSLCIEHILIEVIKLEHNSHEIWRSDPVIRFFAFLSLRSSAEEELFRPVEHIPPMIAMMQFCLRLAVYLTVTNRAKSLQDMQDPHRTIAEMDEAIRNRNSITYDPFQLAPSPEQPESTFLPFLDGTKDSTFSLLRKTFRTLRTEVNDLPSLPSVAWDNRPDAAKVMALTVLSDPRNKTSTAGEYVTIQGLADANTRLLKMAETQRDICVFHPQEETSFTPHRQKGRKSARVSRLETIQESSIPDREAFHSRFTGPDAQPVSDQNLVDRADRLSSGCSFLDDEATGLNQHREELLHYVTRCCPKLLLDSGKLAAGQAVIDHVKGGTWLEHVLQYSELLLVLMYINGGAPPRGPEMDGLRIVSGAQGRKRNIFLYNGSLAWISFRDYKTHKRIARDRTIPHFIPV